MIDVIGDKLSAAINGCHLAAVTGSSHGRARRQNYSLNRIWGTTSKPAIAN
jgi:hypothetical protein